MILSDRGILKAMDDGSIEIDPFDINNLQPASYDLHLGRFFQVFDRVKQHVIDPKLPLDDAMVEHIIDPNGHIVLHPGDFALGVIQEKTGVSDSLVGRLDGKSSVGRLGCLIHVTAGFLDPGNSLQMTLELSNVAPLPLKLYPGMPIAQIAFETMDGPAINPYGSGSLTSKYSGDTRPVASQMHKNWNPETGEWK